MAEDFSAVLALVGLGVRDACAPGSELHVAPAHPIEFVLARVRVLGAVVDDAAAAWREDRRSGDGL